MSSNQDPSPKPSRRLSPDELAGEIAKRLRSGRAARGEHRERRFDIVTVGRIGLGVGIVLVAIGVLFAVAWISRLAGFETPGTVIEETPVFGCPGEPEAGVLFSGETVQLVGVSEDGAWYAVRDERGPGDVVYADALQIDAEGDVTQLETRPCEPRDSAAIAAAESTTSLENDVLSTANSPVSTTVVTAEDTTTSTAASPPAGRPPRRGTPSPGTTTSTTTTTTTTTRPAPGSSSSTSSIPGSSTSTTRPPAPSTSTSTSTTSTSTTSTTTTSTTMLPTTTTTAETTTTSETVTTSTDVTTTTTPPP